MTTMIISSSEDPASTNIKNALLKHSSWEEYGQFFNDIYYKSISFQDLYLITIQNRIITHEGIEEEIKNHLGIQPTAAIYISRHRSKTGNPTLTTHPIGNFGMALFGGKTNTISPTLPHYMTALLRLINKNRIKEGLTQQVCYEVTHHGPYMSIPTLFAEVGSSEIEWKKQKPAYIIAKSIIQLMEKKDEIESSKTDIPVLIGIGGGHYAPRFTDFALAKNVAFSHMIPSYHINQGTINENIFKNVIKVSAPIHGVYLHRKALKKSQRTLFKNWCNNIDIPVVSSNDFIDVV
jgi:D-aminoacyl-tRNA deacylase